MTEPFSWDATYAIAKELKRQHPKFDLGEVSLNQIYLWTIAPQPDLSERFSTICFAHSDYVWDYTPK